MWRCRSDRGKLQGKGLVVFKYLRIEGKVGPRQGKGVADGVEEGTQPGKMEVERLASKPR